MTPQFNILIEQRSTYVRDLEYLDSNEDPIDISDYQAKLEVKENYSDTTALITLTELDGIDIVDNILTFTFRPEHTTNLECKKYFYDLLIKSPLGVVTKLIKGHFEIYRTVTSDIS